MAYQSIHLGTKIDEGVTRALELPSNETGKGASQVGIEDADGNYTATNVEEALKESAEQISTHTENTLNPHAVTKSQIGLGNVDNVKQMPISGGTFTGVAVAQANTSYTTRQLRNVIMSTSNPSGGNNGDIWIKYT